MNTQTTIEQLKQLRLRAMSEFYHQSVTSEIYRDYSLDEFLSEMVQREIESKEHRKIERLIRTAGFRDQVSVQNIDYTGSRGLDKNKFNRLLELRFIREKENVILTGATGVGKSYLAQSLGMQSCLAGFKVKYYNWMDLSESVKESKIEGTYLKLLTKIKKTDVLIIDDFGLYAFDNYNRSALMDIIETKYEQGSVIISSQIPVSQWHQLIGEGTIADAILDRLTYSSHRVELEGESFRKNKQLKG